MYIKCIQTFLDLGELILIITISIVATAVMLIIIGPILFLHIRQKFAQRAKIVDLSQVTKSAEVPEAKPSNQFVVRGNDDKAFYFINYPQNPLSNEENDVYM